MNLRISQKIKTKKQIKYLRIIIDELLSFKTHIESVKEKITQAIALLANLKQCVLQRILKSVYFALFDSHMRYGCQIWWQN